MQCNGKLRKRHPDGAEEVVPEAPMAPMSETDIEAAAASDTDNPPMMPEQEGQLRPIPRVKTLRRALGLTQEEFSARYHIPLGTLRDWEQGRSQPDQPVRAFLAVIARAPREVAELLLADSAVNGAAPFDHKKGVRRKLHLRTQYIAEYPGPIDFEEDKKIIRTMEERGWKWYTQGLTRDTNIREIWFDRG
jgi:putative transcriptional regulator